jgi:predicted peptidase
MTVSGLSSGGFMAAQMHNIYSSQFSGAGIFSGGPFYCGQENPAEKIESCTVKPEGIDLDAIQAKTKNLNIDSPENLKDQKVWVFGGVLDTVVVQGVQDKLVDQYLRNGAEVGYINSIQSQHAFPTDLDRNKNPCAFIGDPYINNCGFDGVGSMLSYIFPMLENERVFDW